MGLVAGTTVIMKACLLKGFSNVPWHDCPSPIYITFFTDAVVGADGVDTVCVSITNMVVIVALIDICEQKCLTKVI